jgi:carboxylesterase
LPVDLSDDSRARAFRFEGGPRGCLLLHGFTGTPGEMRPIGERLAAEGYAVIAPELPGHATRVEDLARTRWTDWFAAALGAWDELGRRASPRMVVGLSMGGLLTLHLAHERPAEVAAIAILAPALELTNQRQAELSTWLTALPWTPRRLSIFPKRGFDPARPNYDQIPLRALASMVELQRRVRSELGAIRTPTLLCEGGRDLTVMPRAIEAIASGLGAAIVRRKRFPESGHILPGDAEGPAVVDAVLERTPASTAH